MKPSSCKAKGRQRQQEFAAKVIEVHPHLNEDDVRSTSMGAGGADVLLSQEAKKCFPFEVECKSLKKISVYKYIEQAETHGGLTPIAAIRGNRKKPLVIMYEEDWFSLLAQRCAGSSE